MPKIANGTLPLVLAGPMLRHAATDQLVLWMVASKRFQVRLRLTLGDDDSLLLDRLLSDPEVRILQLGQSAYLYLINASLAEALPSDALIGYDLGIEPSGAGPGGEPHGTEGWIEDWAPHLCMPGKRHPDFVIKSKLDRFFHGSCRRPHHPSMDGLARLDDELIEAGGDPSARPALMLHTGDQIYADEVAGPMLRATHKLIERLGLFHEVLEGGTVKDSRELMDTPYTYYQRERILPATKRNQALIERFFGGVEKPIFTTNHAHNHLVSFAEVLAIYLLSWSPLCWKIIVVDTPTLPDEEKAVFYQCEKKLIDRFVHDLPRSARALAHIPNYMIFDDHDITDDWNLSALWEKTAYGHPLSRRIIGNALIGYLLCQAWGNRPTLFDDLMPALEELFNEPDQGNFLDACKQDNLINQLSQFENWHYSLPTSPRIVVLDTRTHRWHSSIARSRPSGLMDWESLSEFQQTVMNEESVIVVSAAPMFGVKLIEAVQRVFTLFGQPLMVDAENWMAHRGAANVLLNIFGHSRTPSNFIIISGDVHYSFVYDVRLRHKARSPRIWQITSSGIKNQFPNTLLEWFDRLNRWLYSPKSPLNWFTKRRRMRISPRLPTGREAGERLWNRAGIGLVILDENGVPSDIQQLDSDGGGTRFITSSLSD